MPVRFLLTQNHGNTGKSEITARLNKPTAIFAAPLASTTHLTKTHIPLRTTPSATRATKPCTCCTSNKWPPWPPVSNHLQAASAALENSHENHIDCLALTAHQQHPRQTTRPATSLDTCPTHRKQRRPIGNVEVRHRQAPKPFGRTTLTARNQTPPPSNPTIYQGPRMSLYQCIHCQYMQHGSFLSCPCCSSDQHIQELPKQ